MNHRWLARGFVVALHAAALLALWLHRPPRLDAPGERRVTTVRLVEPRRPAPPPREQPRASTMPRLPLPARPPAAVVPALPRPDDAPPVATAPTAAPTPEPATTQPPHTALRLTLPPGYAASASMRSAALNDPRSNTRRQTFEDRIANAAAVTGDWVEERASDGRMRRRRGDTCVETEESRIAAIDRFNENVAPRTAKMTGKPYKCPP